MSMFGKKIKILVLISVLFIFTFSVAISKIYAQEQKDSDFDKLSDQAEISTYNTNPLAPDTDGDGVIDSIEILDKTNPLDVSSNKVNNIPKENEIELIQSTDPIAWYVSRISGIASFVLFTLVVCLGLFMSTKLNLKFMKIIMPATSLESHSFTATYLAFGFLVFHIVALMFDSYVVLQPSEIFIPFLLYRDLTSAIGVNMSFPIGLGVVAMYLAIILIITSHLRGKVLNTKIWRKLHYSSFLFYLLFLIHGISSGTDTKQPWMTAIYISSAVIVTGMIIFRIKFAIAKKAKVVQQESMAVASTTEATSTT